MRKLRRIIEIDDEKCNGCGQCILACAEGALALVDGKARLVGEIYCDGLGACIGECPEGALTVIERVADDFDEQAVEVLMAGKKEDKHAAREEEPMACGCPSTQSMTLERPAKAGAGLSKIASELTHWPVKLKLLNPRAPFLQNADLLLLADCAGVSIPNLHQTQLRGRAVAIACPKFDDLDEHIDKLTEIILTAAPRSISVAFMEVPCCRGLVHALEKAVQESGARVPIKSVKISRTGEILEETELVSRKSA